MTILKRKIDEDIKKKCSTDPYPAPDKAVL
jgi:hypothetical protein